MVDWSNFEPMTVEFGFLAVPADAPGVDDATLYDNLVTGCELHRGLGFRTAWLLEHHFSDYYPCPSPTVLMAHLASRFGDLALGTCVLVTPWHHPLRLAGELAMLSRLTTQPLYIGLGRGTARYEYDAFGVPMPEARDRFRETYEILDAALSGEPFTYEGAHYAIPDAVRVRPAPARERIQLFGAIGSEASLRIMAELGLAPICTSVGAGTADLLPVWNARADELGTRARAAPLRPLLINTIVADSDDAAIAEAQVYMTRYMQAQIDHYGAHHVDIGAVKGYEAWAATFERWKVLTDPEAIVPWTAGQLIGSPDTVAGRLESLIDAGFDHFILHTVTPGTPRDVQLRWATRFAHDVAPRFDAAFATA
jgi:alkanesulfonate monooxygenase SsuD/methylene tetrahydromethanopterin reductase-like flavin-dependent oxidoreductase (luciferase family)